LRDYEERPLPTVSHPFRLALAGGSAALGLAVAHAQPAATRIDVQLSEYKYVPAEIDLNRGQSYVLHLTNTGSKGHDFSAKAFFQAVSLAPGSAAKVKNGGVDLDQGESADIALVPQTAGTYDVKCTHFMHEMLGMKGKIVVR
jgi:plastocyanin